MIKAILLGVLAAVGLLALVPATTLVVPDRMKRGYGRVAVSLCIPAGWMTAAWYLSPPFGSDLVGVLSAIVVGLVSLAAILSGWLSASEGWPR